jgi:hypothetical protein
MQINVGVRLYKKCKALLLVVQWMSRQLLDHQHNGDNQDLFVWLLVKDTPTFYI